MYVHLAMGNEDKVIEHPSEGLSCIQLHVNTHSVYNNSVSDEFSVNNY